MFPLGNKRLDFWSRHKEYYRTGIKHGYQIHSKRDRRARQADAKEPWRDTSKPCPHVRDRPALYYRHGTGQADLPARTQGMCGIFRWHPPRGERVSILLGHESVGTTERNYAPWVRSRQEQLGADLTRAWRLDPVIAAQTSQTRGTRRVHGKNGHP